jgi:hypothetical protein
MRKLWLTIREYEWTAVLSAVTSLLAIGVALSAGSVEVVVALGASAIALAVLSLRS